MRSPLNPDAAALLSEVGEVPLFAPGRSADSYHRVIAEARTRFDPAVEVMRGHLDTSAWDVLVQDESVGRPEHVPVRIYEPAHPIRPGLTLVYFHGGGWALGTLETLDPELRWFCHRLGCVVIAVDYRLAPEHPYPAAFTDCLGVVEEFARTLPGDRLCVAGDSAGGNLAAAVAIACRDRGVQLAGQLLIYPALDPFQSHASHERYGEGYLLTHADMEMYWSCYLPDRSTWTSPTAAPLAEANLTGLAPAVVVTGGFDPLGDEGQAYAARLRASGVRAEHLRSPGLPHGFLSMTGRVPAAAEAVEQFLFHFADVIDAEDAS